MGRIKRYYTALVRLKRSKGFGIHSPFAFHFVLRVLRERNHYYAYEYIEKSSRLLFRIACFFAPKKILILGNANKSLPAILNYSQSCEIYSSYSKYIDNIGNDIPFIVVENSETTEQLINDLTLAVEREAIIVIYNINKSKSLKKVWNVINVTMQYGMSFTNYKMGIIVGRKYLPRHNYTLWF